MIDLLMAGLLIFVLYKLNRLERIMATEFETLSTDIDALGTKTDEIKVLVQQLKDQAGTVAPSLLPLISKIEALSAESSDILATVATPPVVVPAV